MSTEKLFYVDQYIKEFEATVEEVKEKDGKFLVRLNKTAFFPGGGGQAADTGTIDNIQVVDMIEEGKNVYHVLETKPASDEVKCSIDWKNRKDYMQQHLAQHVLSGTFFDLFGANTNGIHLGADVSYVDILGHIEEDNIRKAEKYANKIIGEGHEVSFVTVNRREAKKMGLRRDLATNDEDIRVVKIKDLDINACCGVHPNNTMELQMIKIKYAEKHKGNTRIYFLAGDRAINEVLEREYVLDKLCRELTTGYEEAEKSLKALKSSLYEAREENKKCKASLAQFEVKELINSGTKINNVSVIEKIYEGENMKFLGKLAESLVKNDDVVVLFANIDAGKVNLLFSSSKNLKNVHMGNLLKDSISLIDGRGGGSQTLAQGGGKNVDNLENTLQYAVRRIKENL